MVILKFLGSTTGRWVRGIAGVLLFALGAWLGGFWWILAGVGALVAAAGIFDFCMLAPLAGKPFSGPRFRDSFTS